MTFTPQAVGSSGVAGFLRLQENREFELRVHEASAIQFDSNDSVKVDSGYERIGELTSSSHSVETLELAMWMSSHAAFRAHQSVIGEGGHVADHAQRVNELVAEHSGIGRIVDIIADSDISDGMIAVLADKAISFALGRIASRDHLQNVDPKFLPHAERSQFARGLAQRLGYSISIRQLICIDYVGSEQIAIGIDNHNLVCASIAQQVKDKTGIGIDIVISDSDTGVDYGIPVIGIPTVGASPLGATAGLSIYESLRLSAAAELVRGHDRGVPVVLFRPNRRNVSRANIGLQRRYEDTMDVLREQKLHHGLSNNYFWQEV